MHLVPDADSSGVTGPARLAIRFADGTKWSRKVTSWVEVCELIEQAQRRQAALVMLRFKVPASGTRSP